jgi:hypothetical protein
MFLAQVPDADYRHPQTRHLGVSFRLPLPSQAANRFTVQGLNLRVKCRTSSTFKGWPDR